MPAIHPGASFPPHLPPPSSQIAGLGLSLVHVAAGEELLYLSLDRLTVDYVQSAQSATTELRLQSFQVDCQQASSTMPAIISRADASGPGGKGADGQDLPPLVHLSVVKHLKQTGGAVDWWEYASVRVLELDMALEPPFVQALLDFVVASQVQQLGEQILALGIISKPNHRTRAAESRAAKSGVALTRYGATQRMWYFHKLEIHPIKVLLTFRSNNNWGELGALPIPNIDAAPLCLNSLFRDDLFGIPDEIGKAIGEHYIYAALKQIHRVVLQVEMLGDPVGFVRTLGTGVKDLFYLPAKAVVSSPKDIGKAMAAGGASFAKNTLLAPVQYTGKIAGGLLGGMDRTLAALAMSTVSSSQTGTTTKGGRGYALQGAAGLGKGVAHGLVSIVSEPIKGARAGGVAGFTLGVGKGLVGAAIRPAAGVLQLTASCANAASAAGGEGAGNEATHSARVGRVRPPRMLHGLQRRIAPFSIGEALAKHVLLSTEEGKYLQEPLLHCDLMAPPPQGPPERGRERERDREGGDKERKPTVLVLTGFRLLCVSSGTWRVLHNVPLRKVHTVSRVGDQLLLELVARRAASSGAIGPTRSIACPSDEMAAALHDHVSRAVESSRARRRVWQVPAGEGAKAKQHRRTQSAPSRKAIVDKSSAGGSSADAGAPWHLGRGAAAIRTSHAFVDDPGDVPGASSAPAAAPKKRFLGRRGKDK